MNTTSKDSVYKYPSKTSRIPLPLMSPEQEIQLDKKFKSRANSPEETDGDRQNPFFFCESKRYQFLDFVVL